MIQRGGCLGLLHEASLPLWFSYCLGTEYLDGDGSVQVGIERLVDHAHATLAELRFDPVVAQGLADHDLFASLGDLPAELGMARSVNLAHAAGPNRSRDPPGGAQLDPEHNNYLPHYRTPTKNSRRIILAGPRRAGP